MIETILIDIGIFILGGSFGLILGCCLATGSRYDRERFK